MFLKSLELSGFKSFARPTRLEFPSGITALVGPNGSGKSNIVDAVRWALGEQSMRDLRGQRSEDVIYAGPRRSLGAAEVALTFEDEGGQIGSSWTAESSRWSEVCLARRLYRSGESDYLVNRQKARLRDVLAALRAIGIDAGHHVIVNQGMADALLAATPLERRGLLEQAAGLSPYRDRREEARHKLSITAQNIETAQLVLAELEPRLRLLRRQAKAVEEREEAVRTLRLRQQEWYAEKWLGLHERRRLLEVDLEAAALARKQAADDLERLEWEAETALEAEREWHTSLEVVTAALNMSERERDALKLDLDHLKERADIARRAHLQHGQRASDLRLPIEEAKRRVAAAETTLNELRTSRIEHEMRQPSARSTLNTLQEELKDVEQYEAEHRAAIRKAEEQQAEICDEVLKAKSALTERAHLRELMEKRLAASTGSLANADGKSKQLERHFVEATEHENEALAELQIAEQSLSLHRARAERLILALSRARILSTETASKLASAEASFAGISLQINTRLFESLDIKPGWERAVASTLGSWSKAEASSAQYQRHEVDPEAFLDWRESLASVVENGGHWADLHVGDATPRLRQALMGTILVDEDEQAKAMWRQIEYLPAFQIGSPPIQVVSRSGQRCGALGVRQYGEGNVAGEYLSTKSQIVRLSRRAELRHQRLQALESAELSLEPICETLESKVRVALAAVSSAQAKRDEVAVADQRLQMLRASLVAEHEQSLAKVAEIATSIGALNEEMQRLLAIQREADTEVARLRADGESAEHAVQDLKKRMQQVSEQVAKARQQHETLVARETTHVETMQLAQSDVSRLSGEMECHLEDCQRLTVENQILETEIGHAFQRLKELESVIGEQTHRMDRARIQRPAVEQAQAVREVRSRHLQLVASHEQLVAASSQLEIERDNLRAEIWSEAQIEPSGLAQTIEPPPTDDEIRRLRQRAVQFPEADESVVSDYKELSDRQNNLSRHLEDLNAARNNLAQIMQVADSEMRARFGAALDAVSEEFGRVFQIMLRGGSARLEQIDEDGALEIRAQLPGRRALSSHAFSGGERALVASSLLFGVLRIKPAPFCILDEVDAPLDESNVDRYLNVLHELSQTTQMIVVTHNRATMAAADALYGLTMDDEGVSNLLSLRLDAYEPAV